MAITNNAFRVGTAPASSSATRKRPLDGLRFDWIVTALAAWTVGGIFLDGWAHEHGKVDTSFFTVWHALLYSGYLALAIVLVTAMVVNHRAGYSWQTALPKGYNLSLIGAAIFGLGGVADMLWHTLLGIEVNTEALLSPSHLTLALGIALLASGPLRAAWLRLPARAGGWRNLLPALLSALLVFAMFNFFTQFAHPFVDVFAANSHSSGAAINTKTNFEIYQMRADGRNQTRLFSDPSALYAQPSYSPDGKKIAYSYNPKPGDSKSWSDIYVANVDGANPVRLTNTGTKGDNWYPVWSPDGSRIAFNSMRDGNTELYVMNADGSNQIRLTNNRGWDGVPSWSPDGTKIAFQAERDGKYNIYSISSTGGNETRLTTGDSDNFRPSWSPDGKKIAFNSRRDGYTAIYLMNPDGSNPTRLNTGGEATWYPKWSPDGKQLLFVQYPGGRADIYAISIVSGEITNLTHLPPGWQIDNFNWSPDGNSIIYSGHSPNDSAASSSSGGWQVSLGIAGILLQTALMMGFGLLLLRRWSLPFGTFTLLFTVNAALVSLFRDTYYLLPVALLAGLLADLMVRQLRPSLERRLVLRTFAFLVPALLYGLYFLELAVLGNMVWSVPLWGGAIFLAGVVGVALSYLVFLPAPPKTEAPV
jgi:Tol biopolymer transport system component